MNLSLKAFALFFFFNFSLMAQPSPFGTGQITNQNIGELEDVSNVSPSVSGFGFVNFFPDAQEILQDYNFDIYVPEDYDGSEEYGLVTFINSGNNGGFKSQWLPVFDDKKLIWIAGDNIGNSVNINIRMGVGMAAALRMQEIFNVDQNRIYTSGNSGGARMAHNLAFIYPETFKGAMPSCGGSYIRQVAQDYETQNPDSHYEFILNYDPSYKDYLQSFDQRFANMTSYNDFREGDIMNIYHNGSEEDGFKGKFLETEGNHCATTTEHFEDAINFVEHPFIEVINEDFSTTNNTYFKGINANVFDSSLELDHSSLEYAQIQSRVIFNWNDPKGAILETEIQLEESAFNSNSSYNLGVWSMEDQNNYCAFIGNTISNNVPGILLNIDFSADQPTLTIGVNNPELQNDTTLFVSTFSDWTIDEPLTIKYHLWDEELRVEVGAHLSTPIFSLEGAKLLDDQRSIRIRWGEISIDNWADSIWSNGAFLTMTSNKLDQNESASSIFINDVELITADTLINSSIPYSSSEIDFSICDGESLVFNNEVLTTSGNYTFIFNSYSDCDSLINLNLIVHELPIVEITDVDGTLSTDGDFIGFQWYFNGELLAKENNNELIPNESGEYSLSVVNEFGCVGNSNVINYVSTSTTSIINNTIEIFPNPTIGKLSINCNNNKFNADLHDIYGRKVVNDLKQINDISHLENGIYFLRIYINNENTTRRILKQN